MAKRKILRVEFFDRGTLTVAQELLGKFLVRKSAKRKAKKRSYMITEVEAYDGFHDRASHARSGKTARNEIMYRSAGHIYIYFTYGMHWMLNIVTGPAEYPAAVLIRAVMGVDGRSNSHCLAKRENKSLLLIPSERRQKRFDTRRFAAGEKCASRISLCGACPVVSNTLYSQILKNLGMKKCVCSNRISGPGRVARELAIDKKLNGKVLGKGSGLWIEDRGAQISSRQIQKTPRIGIAYAGEWVHKKYRFVLKS